MSLNPILASLSGCRYWMFRRKIVLNSHGRARLFSRGAILLRLRSLFLLCAVLSTPVTALAGHIFHMASSCCCDKMCAMHAKPEANDKSEMPCHKKNSNSSSMKACCKTGDTAFVSPNLPEIILVSSAEHFFRGEIPTILFAAEISPVSRFVDPPYQPPRA